MPRICSKCLLSDNIPGSCFDEKEVCLPCREYSQKNSHNDERRQMFERDLEKALQNCRGEGEYDCLLSLSGGKDSLYLLHKLVHDYRLKVLAYTSNFDIPAVALENIRRTVKKLNVDHIVYTPPENFYKKFIRYLLKHQGPKGAVHTVCYFWLDIREGDTLKLAVEKNIPLILTGYSPGQPDPERMFYEMPQKRIREDWTPHQFFHNGLFDQSEKSRFWNPFVYPEGTRFPRILAPFHAWPYNQAEIMSRVAELGFVAKRIHANPIVTNFSLNWLFIYSDLIHLGYNPYQPEFAKLVREGKADRRLWLVLLHAVNFMVCHQIFLGREVKEAMKWLDIKPEDLQITASEYQTQTRLSA